MLNRSQRRIEELGVCVEYHRGCFCIYCIADLITTVTYHTFLFILRHHHLCLLCVKCWVIVAIFLDRGFLYSFEGKVWIARVRSFLASFPTRKEWYTYTHVLLIQRECNFCSWCLSQSRLWTLIEGGKVVFRLCASDEIKRMLVSHLRGSDFLRLKMHVSLDFWWHISLPHASLLFAVIGGF